VLRCRFSCATSYPTKLKKQLLKQHYGKKSILAKSIMSKKSLGVTDNIQNNQSAALPITQFLGMLFMRLHSRTSTVPFQLHTKSPCFGSFVNNILAIYNIVFGTIALGLVTISSRFDVIIILVSVLQSLLCTLFYIQWERATQNFHSQNSITF
jgi:hypothetical protein